MSAKQLVASEHTCVVNKQLTVFSCIVKTNSRHAAKNFLKTKSSSIERVITVLEACIVSTRFTPFAHARYKLTRFASTGQRVRVSERTHIPRATIHRPPNVRNNLKLAGNSRGMSTI